MKPLDISDFRSTVWAKLQAHIDARIELLRAENDRLLPMDQTMVLRGRISELKNLLALAEGPADEADRSDALLTAREGN